MLKGLHPTIVFVGEAPGRHRPDASPLFPLPRGSAGWRLFTMSPIYDEARTMRSMTTYLEDVRRINLLPECSASDGWSVRTARLRASSMLRGGLLTGQIVVLLGKRVLRAFCDEIGRSPNSVEPASIFWEGRQYSRSWRYHFDLAYLPHPSGRNRWYNDRDNFDAARALLTDVFDRVRDGEYDVVNVEEV